MKTTILVAHRLLMAAALFLLVNVGSAQASDDAVSVFNHLTKVEGAEMTLNLDLTYLLENRRDDEYHDGALTVESTGEAYPVKVRLRGKFRRMNSEVPPLKIKFKKKFLLEAGFDTLNEMKLVLPSFDTKNGNDLVLREYVAYRMFEEVSPYALRARLIRLTLVDNHNPKNKMTMYAILLEDVEELCARLRATEVEQFGINPSDLNMEQAAMVSMFEYLIGNTDWDISMLRNVKVLQIEGQDKYITVPYDFDFSGLVSAPYATPSSESGLRNVRDRFLMANGLDEAALEQAIITLKAEKEDLFSICMMESLRRASQSDMMTYLNTFFQEVESDNAVPVMMKVK